MSRRKNTANRYAPTVRALHEKFAPLGVRLFLVYADATDEAIRSHQKEFSYPWPYLRDPQHQLVNFCEATVTPEAAIFSEKPEQLYLGRIDDRFVSFGKERAEASSHDLERAINAGLAGEPISIAETQAIGCRNPTLEVGKP